jgi:hypothetical protein
MHGVLMAGGLQVSPAQQKTDQGIPTLRTQSNVVFVPTLVKDRAGKPVFGSRRTS